MLAEVLCKVPNVMCVPNSVSNEHLVLGPYYLGTLLFARHGGYDTLPSAFRRQGHRHGDALDHLVPSMKRSTVRWCPSCLPQVFRDRSAYLSARFCSYKVQY